MISANSFRLLWHGRLARATRHTRRGATLLVTLGVLTVLSVMVVTFLLTARHQSLSAKHHRDKTVARQALDVALTRALQFTDEAMIASNYTAISSATLSADGKRRRVSPVGRWYSKDYDTENRISSQIDYQTQDILLVPVTNDQAHTVDLLTDEVRRLLPPALTNRLGSTLRPLLSGWIPIHDEARVSFAVLNCSGFIDAHTYDFDDQKALRSATQHVARAFFTRQDLVNAAGSTANELADIGVLSYDPGPTAMPLYPQYNGVHPSLGYREFSITNKFNINSVTNYFDPKTGRVRATRQFEERWLKIVTNELAAADRFSDNHADVTLGSVQKVAWNIANYMSPSRVPVISYPGVEIASRADYGIEDVPLINEAQVFKCTDESGNSDAVFSDAIEKLKNDLFRQYNSEDAPLDPIIPSNLYAAAVEVWHPFVPRPIPGDLNSGDELRVYIGVYTNKGDLSTTTNSSWSASDLADYYGLDDPTVAELYINILNDDLLNNPDSLTNSVFWSKIRTDFQLMSVIENPSAFNETNLFPIATGLAAGMVWVFTDPDTGLIATNNPFTGLIYEYAPADTNMTPEEVTNYYATASNYFPVVTILLTNRLEDITSDDNGSLIDGSMTVRQQSLPASKIAVGPFPPDYYPKDGGKRLEFNKHGFCVVTNTDTLVCFPLYKKTVNENTGLSTGSLLFYPLGDKSLGATLSTWIRPLVAVKEKNVSATSENEGFEAVDEALLTEEGNSISVMEWTEEASFSVADPRINAWYSDASAVSAWYKANNTFGATNESPLSVTGALTATMPGVSELPFIHADAPFQSIGELGHITVDLDAKEYNRLHRPDLPARDTIDFSTRVGAATLDRFTIASTNAPMYGLIQANTTYEGVIRKILKDIPMGWTNDIGLTGVTDEHAFPLNETDEEAALLTANWTNTLLRTATYYGYAGDEDINGRPGWTCFADMLPDLSTNALAHLSLDFAAKKESNTYYKHDYMEDVMRGLVDKVSFRQNIYVIIVAAQTVSPASTEANPIVVADQRAAVTVIRDAYTGRWLIHSWVWLTE